MTSILNFNTCKQMLTMYQDANMELIRNVCTALGCEDRVDEMVGMFIDKDAVKCLKNKKDPRAPKRPRSTYLLFSAEIRSEVIKQNPGIAFQEVAKEIGVRWNQLTDKSKYEAMAEQDKLRYEQELHAYRQRVFQLSTPQGGVGSKHALKPSMSDDGLAAMVAEDEADSSGGGMMEE